MSVSQSGELRNRGKGSVRPHSAGAPPPRPSADSELRRLALALAALSDDQRRILELRDGEGLAWDDVAARLGRDPASARKFRARALLELGRFLTRRTEADEGGDDR